MEKFHCYVHPGRWGSLAHATRQVLLVRNALTIGWSLARFNFQRPAGRGGGEGDDKTLEIANAAITSPAFWGFCVMLNEITEVITRLMQWCEGCPCHFKEVPCTT